MSAESYKGGEINSQQAEAISTLASANEYKGKSRIITLLELPWGRKWKYFRDQLLARSAAAVAIAFDEARRSGRFGKGDNVVLVTFGAGLTWSAAVIRW